MAKRKQKEKDTASPKLIKRYGNRKLYDTEQSRYVTLDEISRMVRRGEDIRVVDNKTKEDLTNVTLTQIMLENQRNKYNTLPLALLKNLIQQGGESLAEWLQRSVESLSSMRVEAEGQIAKILEKGQETREESTQILREWLANPHKPLDLVQKKIDERIRYFFFHLTGLDDLEREIEELEQKIDEIEHRLASREP